MSLQRIARCAVLAGLFAPAGAGAQSSVPVDLVVRVFDGTDEVTEQCQIAVYAADARVTPLLPELRPDSGHHVAVAPGLYDVRITRRDEADTVAIAWAEHLSVLRYPDDGTEHVEIINLQPEFGALLVRPPDAWRDGGQAWGVSAFLHGGVGRAGFEGTGDPHHRLFILPAGRYDLVADLDRTEIAVSDVEVPAQRTRLLLLEVR